MDCAFPTRNDLTSVIQSYLRSGDASSLHDINVTASRPLCLAHSAQRHRYRGISVLVEYTCRGPATCPGDGGPIVWQLDAACVDGEWSNRILGSTSDFPTTSPAANFSTPLREDCAFCLSPELAGDIGAPLTDTKTHCLGKLVAKSQLIIAIWPDLIGEK